MLLFIIYVKNKHRILQNFKTSHVIVYLCDRCVYCPTVLFQNISCYCLSNPNQSHAYVLYNFKTSHVIVYRFTANRGCRRHIISKHLMLLFIKHRWLEQSRIVGISKHLMLLFILCRCTAYSCR